MVIVGLVQTGVRATAIMLEAYKSCIIWCKCGHSKMNLEANSTVFLGTGWVERML